MPEQVIPFDPRILDSLQIAHHIPGRIRLRLAPSLADAPAPVIADAKRLVAALDEVPGIRAVRLNLVARSCTVEYDPRHIAPVAWDHLANGVDSPEAATLLAVLRQQFGN